ncbi:MAG: GNAT family N-acetyltransferase [Candidatus Nanopelagicales bacterium]
MQISVRPLAPGEEELAALVLTAAFVDEPYVVELHGPDRLERWAARQEHHRHDVADGRYDVRLLAVVGDAPAGVLLGSQAGRCWGCARAEPATPAPEGDADGAWYRACAEAHRTQPPHAWVAKLAVVPALQGRGLARHLLAAMDDAVRAAGGDLVVLECQPHRERFYEGSGYRRTLLIPDPAGPDAPLMLKPL